MKAIFGAIRFGTLWTLAPAAPLLAQQREPGRFDVFERHTEDGLDAPADGLE